MFFLLNIKILQIYSENINNFSKIVGLHYDQIVVASKQIACFYFVCLTLDSSHPVRIAFEALPMIFLSFNKSVLFKVSPYLL